MSKSGKIVLTVVGVMLALMIALPLTDRHPPEVQWDFLKMQASERYRESEGGWLMEGRDTPFGAALSQGPPRRTITRTYPYQGSFDHVVKMAEEEALRKGGTSLTIANKSVQERAFRGPGWTLMIFGNYVDPLSGRVVHQKVTILATTVWDESPIGKAKRLVRSWLPKKSTP
jgi:hypothetical protein